MNTRGFFTLGHVDGEYGGLILNLPSNRGVMEYQIEMAANNDIEGLLPFCHIIADGKPRFRYDVGSLLPLNRYMEQYKPDIRLAAEVLLGVSSAICGLEKYLLEEKCVILELDMVYIESACHSIKLVYLPVDPPDGEYTTFQAFVTELLKFVDTGDATSKLFRRRILEEVKKTGFRYETFTDFLLDIICFSGDGSGEPSVLPDAGMNMSVNGTTGKNAKSTSGRLIGKKPRNTPASALVKAGGTEGNGNQALLLPLLCGILVIVAYFGIYSVLRGAYQSAVLLVAIATELLLLWFFVQMGNRCKAAAVTGGNMGGGIRFGGGEVGNVVRAGSDGNERGTRVKKREKGSGLKKLFGKGRAKKAAAMDMAVTAAQQLHSESIAKEIQSNSDNTGNTGNGSTVDSKANLWEASLAEPLDGVPESSTHTNREPVHTAFDHAEPMQIRASLKSQASALNESPETVAVPGSPVSKSHETVAVHESPVVVSILEPQMPSLPEQPRATVFAQETAAGFETTSAFQQDTEVLSAGRDIFATLLIREGMREYGIILRNGGFIIGRQADCTDMTLDNPAVGKLHAKIEFDGLNWTICDLNSRNGTYINNIRVEGNTKRYLKNKDVITIANADMVFKSLGRV